MHLTGSYSPGEPSPRSILSIGLIPIGEGGKVSSYQDRLGLVLDLRGGDMDPPLRSHGPTEAQRELGGTRPISRAPGMPAD